MNRKNTHPARAVAALVAAPLLLSGLTAATAPAAHAQKAATKGAAKTVKVNKTAEQIIEDSIKASGGRAALAKIKTTVTEGTLSLPAQGINGTMAVQYKAPGKYRMSQTIQGIGETTSAFDGKVAWSKDPINGLRVLSGAELEQAKRGAEGTTNPLVQWKQLYKKWEVLGVRPVGTAKAYAVRLTPKVGKPAVQYFDTKTGLLVRMDQVLDTPNGQIASETYLSDYRTLDGIKTPFKVRSVIGGGLAEVLMTFTSVKNNVPVDDSVFAKPAEDAAPAAAPTAKKG